MKIATYCELDRPIPKMSAILPNTGTLPFTIQSIPSLQKSILAANSKKDVIKALREWVSSRGGFSDAPKELHDKLNDMCRDKN